MSARRAVMWLVLLTLALVALTAAVDLLGLPPGFAPATPVRRIAPPLSDTPTLTASAPAPAPLAVALREPVAPL